MQCDPFCPPLTSTPKKGRVLPVIADADPFELTEKRKVKKQLNPLCIVRPPYQKIKREFQ